MKSTIYKALIGATLIIGLSSCVNNWLDVEPGDQVEADEAVTTSADLSSVRAGMYQIIKGTSDFKDYYAARMFYYGEVRGEDMQTEKSGSRSQLCYDMTYSTADNAPSIWQTPYIVIGRANRIIEAAESGKLTDKEEAADIIAQYAAEAKVARAMAHFDLVRVYGKTYTAPDAPNSLGIPVVTTVLGSDSKLIRNTVSEVYTQVIKDLNEAINSKALSESSTPGYINLWAAKALLSRVYLTQGDNQKSLDVAEDIIKNSPYKLWKNEEYVGAWSKISGVHSNEMLFEIAITGSTDWTDREGIAYLYNEDGYADIIATKKFLDLLNEDPDDVRLGVFLAPTTKDFKKLYGTNTVFLNKYPADGLSDLRYNNVPLVRLSEVYLNAAEAAAKLGNQNDKAVEYLDAILKRANPNKTVKGTTVTVDRVLLERRKELIGEGHRFFDAMRNNETVIRYTSKEDQGWQQALKEEARSFNRDFYKTLLPIPQDEIDANPSMKDQQNTGY